jgi:hypothetical protein
MYEINFSPHTGYNAYSQSPTWTTTPTTTSSGCPEGQVMGPDGICRVDPNYTGQPTFDETATTPTTPADEVTQAMASTAGGGGFTGGAVDDAYQRQQDLYKRVSAGAIGQASPGDLANLRMDKYQTLPGGMKNWSESQLFQYALDRNFFTGEDRLGVSWKDYAKQIPKPGEHRYADYNKNLQNYFNQTMIGTIGQVLDDKSFDDWVKLALNKGIIAKEGDKYKILKGPGANEDALYAGGYLVPLDEYKQVETNYAQGYFTPVEAPDPGVADIDVTTISNLYDDLNDKGDYWWYDTYKTWFKDGYSLSEADRDEDAILREDQTMWPPGLYELALDDLMPSIETFNWYPSAPQIEPDYFGKDGEAMQIFKNHVLNEAKIFDEDRTRKYTIPGKEGMSQQAWFDKAHPDYDFMVGQFNETTKEFEPGLLMQGEGGLSRTEADRRYWMDRAGIPKEDQSMYHFAPGIHTEEPRITHKGTGTVYSATVDLSKPVITKNMNYAQQNAVYGENSVEVTIVHGGIFNSEQKTDRVQANDGSNNTTEGWGYNADGRFVNVNTGQTAAMGSYSDGVEAIKSGTASSKLLDRFHWESDANTTGYSNKEEYMAAKDTKVMYRNNDGEQTTVNSGNYDSKDDNSKGKIVCDYFYRKGLLSERLWRADEAYGEELSRTEPDVMKGYHAWARHYVREMEKESLLGKVYFAWAKLWVPHWAKYLAGEKTIRGKILHSIGKPICNMIGKLNRRIKWQQA